MPGSTRVWNSPSTSPPRTLTAPISVIALSVGEPPVVSRSTTTKVTADSGVPSSSIDTCSYTGNCWGVAAPARGPGRRPGEGGTGRTVGRGNDSPGDARRAVTARRSPDLGAVGAQAWVPLVTRVGETGLSPGGTGGRRPPFPSSARQVRQARGGSMLVRSRWRTRRWSASLLAVVAAVVLGVVFPLAAP